MKREIENRLVEYQEESTRALLRQRRSGPDNFYRDTSPSANLLEKKDELRRLEKAYGDLHSVKDDLFGLCNRLKDTEPDLGDQLRQFCCRVHERCETNYSQILDLKEDLGCRYYWQVPCDNR